MKNQTGVETEVRLADGGSVQDYIKAMTEVFDELTVMDDPVKEEYCVVYLLASLSEHYNVLVTVLEASPEVPAFAVVTGRLLYEESKMKNNYCSADTYKNILQAQKNNIMFLNFCGVSTNILDIKIMVS